MAKSRKTRKERLEAIKEKIANTDVGSGRKGFFSPKEGKNKIRILPEVGDMDFFYQEVGRHYIGGKHTYCPSFTSTGDLDCPICEVVNDLYKSGDKASKKLAGELRVRRAYWMNVIDRNDEDAGPQIFTPGVMIFSAIAGYISDPDYGDIYDEEDGIDITIERSGTGMDTEYQTRCVRHSSPLSADDDLCDEWLNSAKDLSWVELSDDPEEDKELADGYAVYVLPYDRLLREYDLDIVLDEPDDDDEYEDDEEEEEEHPVKRRVSERRKRRSRRR